MTLYLKYRPQKIDELDLESVRATLAKIVASKEIPHGFLFSGPKGTGKTSSARILAKIINCEAPKDGEPCNKCEQCISITKGTNIDVIELDGASNRGIDDVRSLKETIALAPSLSKKKIYIIDEAHMLTTEASNALLKTLEEPPDHVIFILATTNPEKLPVTVRSRLTNIVFTKATAAEIGRQLERVTKGEKVKISKDAVNLIAKASDGSFRDAVKILESLMWDTKDITKEVVENSLSKGSDSSVKAFLETLSKKDTKQSIEIIEKMSEGGISLKGFTDEILNTLHDGLLEKVGLEREVLVNFTQDEILNLIELFTKAKADLAFSPIAELPLEIAVIKWGGSANKKKEEIVEIKEAVVVVEAPPAVAVAPKPVVYKDLDDGVWKKLLETIKNKNTSIEALLRAAKPMGMDGKTIIIGVYYQFHKERLETTPNKRFIEEVICNLMGNQSLKVAYQLTEREIVAPTYKEEVLTAANDKDIIDAAKEIFGS